LFRALCFPVRMAPAFGAIRGSPQDGRSCCAPPSPPPPPPPPLNRGTDFRGRWLQNQWGCCTAPISRPRTKTASRADLSMMLLLSSCPSGPANNKNDFVRFCCMRLWLAFCDHKGRPQASSMHTLHFMIRARFAWGLKHFIHQMGSRNSSVEWGIFAS